MLIEMERILPIPVWSLFYSALQRVDLFTGLTVGVEVIFYLQFRKTQELDQRILALDSTGKEKSESRKRNSEAQRAYQ